MPSPRFCFARHAHTFAIVSIVTLILSSITIGDAYALSELSVRVAERREQRLLAMQELKPAASARSDNDQDFPAFQYTAHPVSAIPNWGAMRTPAQWNRSFAQMEDDDFVAVPSYDLAKLTIPLRSLLTPLSQSNIVAITAKLYYSTRHFGAYHLDSDEFSAVHPGVDLKLASGTPVGAVAGGRVHFVGRDSAVGIHVVIEHHTPDNETVYSIYGHLQDTTVQKGDDVSPGTVIGHIGMTGNTTAPHLHLQIDKKSAEGTHTRYWPVLVPTREEADRWTIHPIDFIEKYAN